MEIANELSPREPGGLVPVRLRRIADGMGAFGALLVLSLALLINSDVLSRFFLNHPIKGVAEMVELAIVVIVFIQLPLTIATGGLVRASELHHRVSQRRPGVGRVMSLTFELVGVVVFALLTWALWPKLTEAWIDNLYKGQPGLFTVPIWPAVLVTLVGSAISATCFLTSFWYRLRRSAP